MDTASKKALVCPRTGHCNRTAIVLVRFKPFEVKLNPKWLALFALDLMCPSIGTVCFETNLPSQRQSACSCVCVSRGLIYDIIQVRKNAW